MGQASATVKFRLLDLSPAGARIEHLALLRPDRPLQLESRSVRLRSLTQAEKRLKRAFGRSIASDYSRRIIMFEGW
jgi:hypothetical protein